MLYIYRTINKITGKSYIGQRQLKKKTFSDDNDYLGSGILINRSIEKYGKENFEKTLIAICKDIDELNNAEIFWIAKLNTLIPNGYNIAKGGHGWSQGFAFDDERRKKCSEVMKRILNTPKAKKNMSLGQKRRFSQGHTAEHLKNLSLANTGYKHSENAIKKMVLVKKGKKSTEETKKKISASLKGKNCIEISINRDIEKIKLKFKNIDFSEIDEE